MVRGEPLPTEAPVPQPPSYQTHEAPVPSEPPLAVSVKFPPIQIWPYNALLVAEVAAAEGV